MLCLLQVIALRGQSPHVCGSIKTLPTLPFPTRCYPYGGSGSGATEGVAHTNPKYLSAENPYGGGNGLPAFSYRDVGVVVLNVPVNMDKYAELPEAGIADTLKNKTGVDFVGYGVQYQAQIPGNQLPTPPSVLSMERAKSTSLCA